MPGQILPKNAPFAVIEEVRSGDISIDSVKASEARILTLKIELLIIK